MWYNYKRSHQRDICRQGRYMERGCMCGDEPTFPTHQTYTHSIEYISVEVSTRKRIVFGVSENPQA